MSRGIEIKNLSFAYDGQSILDGIDLSIERGAIVTMLGPNGCGKTTLLKTLNGLLRPKGGEVIVDGRAIDRMSPPEIARMMGHVPQGHRSSFPFTVLDIVLTGRLPHISTFSAPGERDEEVAKESLDLVGAGHLTQRPYTQISGGERQMVMIARALAQEPQFLLLDEPTSYLDFKNQIGVLKTVRKIADREGVTVIMTLHDPNHALAFSDHVVLLRKLDGKKPDGNGDGSHPHRANVVAFGPPFDVMTPMNIQEAYGMEVELVEHNGRRILLPL